MRNLNKPVSVVALSNYLSDLLEVEKDYYTLVNLCNLWNACAVGNEYRIMPNTPSAIFANWTKEQIIHSLNGCGHYDRWDEFVIIKNNRLVMSLGEDDIKEWLPIGIMVDRVIKKDLYYLLDHDKEYILANYY